MVKTIETRAVISAQDKTGATFEQIAAKIRKMEQSAAIAGQRVDSVTRRMNSPQLAAAMTPNRQRVMQEAIQVGAAALASSRVAKAIVHQASTQLHERIRMENAGMNNGEVAHAMKEARDLSREFKPIGQTEIMHMLRNTRSVVGTYEEAAHMMKPLLNLRVISQHNRPGASAEEINEDFDKLVKAAEVSGVTQDLPKFRRYIDGIAKAMNVFGDTIRPYQFFEAAKYGRQATTNLSERYVSSVLPTLIQELGGSSTGQAQAAFFRALVGGKMSNLAVNEMAKIGLIDPSKVTKTKTGNIKGLAPGGIYGSALAASDPDLWVNQYLMPALVKHGVTDHQKQQEIIARIFSNQVAAQISSIFATQRSRIEKDAALTHGAKGAEEAARAIMDKDLGQAVVGLHKQVDALAAAMGKPFMEPLTKKMNTLSDMAGGATEFLNKDQNAAAHAAIGAVGAATAATYFGGAWGLGAMGIGAGVSAVALPATLIGAGLLGLSYATTDMINRPRDTFGTRGVGSREAANLYDDQQRQLERARSRGDTGRVASIESDMASTRYRMGEWRPNAIAPGLSSQGFNSFAMNHAYGQAIGGYPLYPWSDKLGAAPKGQTPEQARVAAGIYRLGEGPSAGVATGHAAAVEHAAQKQQVDVKVTADPIEIKNSVQVGVSSEFIRVVEGAKEATRSANLRASVGSTGSTDFGNQQPR